MVDRNPGLVTGLAVAPEIGMLYWSDDDGDGMETLYQGRMDGTSIEQIKTFGKVKLSEPRYGRELPRRYHIFGTR